MSREAVPETPRQTSPTGRAAHQGAGREEPRPGPAAAPEPLPAQDGGAPKGLLQQMEELMAALNADLSQLDADIQSSTDRLSGAEAGAEAGAGGTAAAAGEHRAHRTS
ncbi:hypothetical protein AB0O42_22620 [Streptomyces sp. NPDC089922]|uniref:hypothetical protein n=1 Tax=Streptomyces sp. NPDC089922 TaxID=3155189 RepID=UPI00344A6DB1